MQEVIEILDTDSDEGVPNNGLEESSRSLVSFSVSGQPIPLPRMRHFRNGFWNKAKKRATIFQNAVKLAIPSTANGVIFNKSESVSVTIWFSLRRPASDFVGGKRIPAGLRNAARFLRFPPTGPDIDNLTKFVLDALNGLVYKDDRQVVKLVVYKLRNNSGHCEGSTTVEVAKYIPTDNSVCSSM